ncbi:MAG: ammonia-forming cytochrome c nitrite reductase subunit c552 [Kiritimatiellia bacterium]|jgi:Flp pilus assembly protein TadD|nr:ammonia-forming cytochrome c nitrite reductase subunit c552 [Kiritimatiellia bacterium]MDP6848242.1 ammonia-forming cytochrome c nitrite reductase subunit c552 [Kiritimatiellia bacterium]
MRIDKSKAALVLIVVATMAALLILVSIKILNRDSAGMSERFYVGSESCRECHERFYGLWGSSHHGKAMQPVTKAFAESELTPQTNTITVGNMSFIADLKSLRVKGAGPQGKREYPILHALGGKNVYYFLTPLERGRLQVLPVAYNVDDKAWFNTTASMVRHFGEEPDAPIEWTDPMLTFNTACYGCHVSQLSRNYDLETDSYQTTWREPGINCETCHGPSGEHIRVCKEAPEGTVPENLELITMDSLTQKQRDDTCVTCHAKMRPLTEGFRPGDRFFDHYDLVLLEDRDFYPDGRDLGENYTYTGWLMSPCVKAGKLECIHCHTSSGRFRFAGEKANEACLPCHAKLVADVDAHSHHPKKSGVDKCIDCHMPMTRFANMRRSDHSMLSPTPAATIAVGSPNACNMCHKDKDAEWANEAVTKWYGAGYQDEAIKVGALVKAARGNNWSKLPDILEYISSEERDEVVAASLIRLLSNCDSDTKTAPLLAALKQPSPLIRSSVAGTLQWQTGLQVRRALIEATRDDYLAVRVRAAESLVDCPQEILEDAERESLAAATKEYLFSMNCRPDMWSSHYNLGNYHMAKNQYPEAVNEFQLATRMRPDTVVPLVNVALAYARLGRNGEAEKALRKAKKIDRVHPAVNFNLGLILAENGALGEAERCLRAALKADPRMAGAAYNLAVIVSRRDLDEAVRLSRKASQLAPDDPKYAYALASYLHARGDKKGAAVVLQKLLITKRADASAYMLLGGIHEENGDKKAAIETYRHALSNDALPPGFHNHARTKLKELQ